MTARLANDVNGTQELNRFGWGKSMLKVHTSVYAEAAR